MSGNFTVWKLSELGIVVGTWASEADFSTSGVGVGRVSVRTWKECFWTRYSRTECLPAQMPGNLLVVVRDMTGT